MCLLKIKHFDKMELRYDHIKVTTLKVGTTLWMYLIEDAGKLASIVVLATGIQ